MGFFKGMRTLIVAISIDEQSHLKSFTGFLSQQIEKSRSDTVVTEYKIFEMDVFLCFAYATKEVVVFHLCRRQKGDFVSLICLVTLLLKF